ncbi:hypothetical protein AKJ63_01505 [candidate division MSBL1 archaeon SCGC-AAA259D18]|uniref:Ribbon-helix-helix protein CopG domain-containing protein n=2 Tax=candidate division MSBL1 TaxID=215777 RepID=A0A133U9R2_9EURY|nr:hypothetical protein AKJ57_03025 [candidate division MSBL1 archaeon SCGC-AAA259A05]KXA91406.1 hypothetical protein AKJ63_01505 [candidate division MSBL1 archaeon SCGC-AAA259D18]
MGETITARIEEELSETIDEIARKEGVDRSAIVRRFLDRGTSEWLIERSLREYEEGRITLWHAAEKCDLSLWEMMREAEKREIQVPYTVEEFKKDIRALE